MDKLTDHNRIHTGEKQHNCEICEKAFRLSTNLTLHKLHTGEKQFDCEISKKIFSSSSDLNVK